MKIIRKIYYWCTKTRLRKILSLTLAILIFFTSIKFIFIPAPKVQASDIYLGMNEGYGTTITDGNGNATGTITNAVWKDESLCKVGKCLYFDGTGDLVNFGDDADLDFVAATNFTIEGWFRTPDITSGTRVLTAKYNSATGTDGGYKVYMDSNGYLIFGIDDDQTSFPEDSASTTTTAFDDNQWHFFSAVKTGTTSITIYVDGKQYQTDSTISATGTLVSTDTFYVGIDGDGSSNGFTGFLDEIKVYPTTARTTAEIKTDLSGETRSRGVSATFGPDNSWISNGLVGYWKMDENTGTTTSDSSGNINTSSAFTGNASWTTGKFGSGITFDGSGDRVDIASSTSINFLSSYTFSLWLNPTTSGTYEVLDKTGGGSTGWAIQIVTGKYQLLVNSDATSLVCTGPNAGVTANVWQHIIFTWDGTSTCNGVKLYLNNVPQTFSATQSMTGTRDNDTGNTLHIGSNTFSNDYSGKIDELRFYNRALSPTEVSKLYSFAPGPVGYWKMDENTGTTAYDISGNANNGTFTGSGQWTTGKFGAGFQTNSNAAQDYVTMGDPASGILDFSNTQDFTYEFWYKHNTTSDAYVVPFEKGGSSTTRAGYDFEIEVSTSNASCNYSNGVADANAPDQVTWSSSNLLDGNWHHIACNRDRNGVATGTAGFHLFVDGILKASLTSFTEADGSTSTRSLNIGEAISSYTNRLSFTDDVKIYNYARSTTQIVEDMNGGHPSPGSPVGSASSYWKFDEGYSTTAHDVSTNANDLTLSTASWTNTGKFGKAFNGLTNVRASRTDDNDLDFAATQDFSLSLWFKSDSTTNPSANEYLLEKGGNIATDAIGYAIYTSAASDGLICFGIDDDATTFPEDSVCSTNDLYDNTWHHIIATKTGTSRLDLYVDGAVNGTPDTSISANGTLENAATFYIGDTNGTDGTDEFLGDIDEVKVYRLALTPDQVKVEYNHGSAEQLGATGTTSTGVATFSDDNAYCPPGQGSTCTAPVGDWRLDENTGTSAFDSSTSNYTGTLTNGPTWATGKSGAAVKFDGSNDNITLGASTNLLRNVASGTISAWVNTSTIGSTQVIVDIAVGTSTNSRMEFGLSTTNTLYCGGRAGDGESFQQSDSSTVLSQNTWYFVTCVPDYANDTVKIYVNGIQIATTGTIAFTATSTSNTAPQSAYIGVDASAGIANPFFGMIDGVKIYHSTLTAAQMAWNYNYGKPVGWWKLDENTGTTANDSMGNSTAGTLTNTPTWVAGKLNQAVAFAGSNQQILIADDPDFDFADDEDMTLTTWFKHSTASSQEIILSKYAAAGYKIIMEADGDITCGLDYDATWTPTDSITSTAATYDDNNWHLISCVKSGATSLSLYIDGLLIGSDSSITATNTLTNADPLYLGIDADGLALDFTGSLDDTRIYRYALNATQIKTLMNDGSVKFTQ